MKEIKNDLIKNHEIELKKNLDFSDGYSPTISVVVTSGSILEAAYNYTQKADDDKGRFFYQSEFGGDRISSKRVRKKSRKDRNGKPFATALEANKELTRLKR